MKDRQLGWVGEVGRFDSEEELEAFLSIKPTWNLAVLKQSFADIAKSIERSDFVSFSPELFEGLTESDLNALQGYLGDFIGLHGDAKYSHWAYVFKRLNVSFLEEKDSLRRACVDSLSRTPFRQVSQSRLLLLLAVAYISESEKWSCSDEGKEAARPGSPKEAQLKNLKEAKAKVKQIDRAADELNKAAAVFERSVSRWAAGRILPDAQRYVDNVLSRQLNDWRDQVEADRSESLSEMDKGWLEPLSAIAQDGKTSSKGSLLVPIFDAIAALASEAAGGGERKEATADLLKSWGIDTKPDSMKHRRRDLPG